MLKVGLIGCGRIAPYHLKAFQAHPSVEIIGVCDLDKTKSNKYAEMFNCKSFYCIDDLLQNDLDLVSVTTGEDQHFMPVMKVLEAKTHVFVEKPLSIKLEEAKTMAKKASGGWSGICRGAPGRGLAKVVLALSFEFTSESFHIFYA